MVNKRFNAASKGGKTPINIKLVDNRMKKDLRRTRDKAKKEKKKGGKGSKGGSKGRQEK